LVGAAAPTWYGAPAPDIAALESKGRCWAVTRGWEADGCGGRSSSPFRFDFFQESSFRFFSSG
jgi:hypothetical protein